MLLPLAGPSDRAARLCRGLNGECHEWKSTANRNPQEASPEGKAAEASSEAGERASARAFHAGSEAAEARWLAEEVVHFSACNVAPDDIVKLTKAQLIDPRDIEVEPIVGATWECPQTVFPHALIFFFCVNNPGSGTTSDRGRRAFRPCKRARATGKTTREGDRDG